jgi:hypothetical protein
LKPGLFDRVGDMPLFAQRWRHHGGYAPGKLQPLSSKVETHSIGAVDRACGLHTGRSLTVAGQRRTYTCFAVTQDRVTLRHPGQKHPN